MRKFIIQRRGFFYRETFNLDSVIAIRISNMDGKGRDKYNGWMVSILFPNISINIYNFKTFDSLFEFVQKLEYSGSKVDMFTKEEKSDDLFLIENETNLILEVRE